MSLPVLESPISVEESVISTMLNCTTLTVFLMGICPQTTTQCGRTGRSFLGIYTMVYLGTLYVYLTGKSAQHRIVIGTLTILYLGYVFPYSVGWYLLNWSLVNNGETRDSAYNAAYFGIGWVTLIGDIGVFLQSTLADGLLIWRCFHVWDCSFRVILVSLVLLLAEIAIYLTLIILAAVNKLDPTESVASLLNQLIGAAAIITVCSTLLTTLLIMYRIYRVSHPGNTVTRSWRTFKHILDILVQSAAVYSLAAILYAFASFVPFDNSKLAQYFALQYYATGFFSFIGCIAPTVMVARVTLTSPVGTNVISTMGHISDIQFQRTITPNVTPFGIDSNRVVN